MRGRAQENSGITFIEIMIVIVIIGILVVVAIPMLWRSKTVANEASAIASLKATLSAQTQFKSMNSRYGTQAELHEDRYLSVGTLKSGYRFIIDGVEMNAWYSEAVPDKYRNTGSRSFFIDESGSIRSKDTGNNNVVTREDAEQWPSLED
jgi:prepilin-type N-terminal cleavage/methylation domain-containing protein